MAVHVGSTDVKFDAEKDRFLNQQLQTRQRLGTLDSTRKVHYISDAPEKKNVVFGFYRLAQQLLGNLKQKQVQITVSILWHC